jgi:hypothetical protein
MTFQTSVALDIGFGVIGELAFGSAYNAQTGILNSADASNNVIGRAFTHLATEGQMTAGGTGVFAGILAAPKTYASRGTTAGGTLAPTLTLANGEQGEFVQGTAGIIVTLGATACNVGDQVIYATATGILATQAPGTAPGAGNALIPGATVVRYEKGSTAGLAVIALNGPVLGTATPA